jgi:hypothetical protein
MNTTTTKVTKSRFGRFKELAENFGVSAFAGILMAGMVTAYFESRLENSKERVTSIIKQKDQVDTLQSDVFAQLGLYTGKVFEKGDTSDKEKLESAIIATQIQLNRLKSALPPEDQSLVSNYESELTNLQRHLRDIKTQNDLGPIFVSAQKILELHDAMSDRVRSNLEVSIF